MKYDVRILVKLALIFFGMLFLICIWLGRKESRREPVEGEKITVEDAEILLQALELPDMDTTFLQEDREGRTPEQESDGIAAYLTYGQYLHILEAIDEIDGDAVELPDYAERYEEEHALLKEDWYAAYRLMLAYFDTESSIWETTVFPLKADIDAKRIYTQSGGMEAPYAYQSPAFEQNLLQQIRVYVKGDKLLTVAEVLPDQYELKNVWIMESADSGLECFYHAIAFHAETEKAAERESVADLVFREGRVVEVSVKNEKVHGKLLRISEEEIEIEDSGVYRLADGMEVYKLYGSLESMTQRDLRIGYADTDFVLYKGEVCAALISETEAADRIRVLLKNTAKQSNFYDAVELIVDEESITLRAEDLKVGERRTYRSDALTDKVQVLVDGNTREDNAYRGMIECYRTAEGIALINELPLEEYLYAVVPSEMPASYPLEALKAQAVCARTYAYRYILHAGIPELGAHVDDTTGYQVYHNIKENAASTTAVKETDGILLTCQGEPAQNYYYSTSCGVGTGAEIWQSGDAEELSYLQAVRIVRPDENAAAQEEEVTEELRAEDAFYRFITTTDERDLEKEEPWYRWNYQVEEIDTEKMQSRIQARYKARPSCVLTKTEGEYYVSQPVEKLGTIKGLFIARRGAGGVAQELVIETDTGTYKVLAEYNIRSVLCDGVSKVVKQDGSTVVAKSLLPSGFFVLETGKASGNVVGYTLTGGGYGHGVGMSQNGARALGEEGTSYEVILTYFFPGCELDSIRHS